MRLVSYDDGRVGYLASDQVIPLPEPLTGRGTTGPFGRILLFIQNVRWRLPGATLLREVATEPFEDRLEPLHAMTWRAAPAQLGSVTRWEDVAAWLRLARG